jgi:TrmH family RNA methyltransferase
MANVDNKMDNNQLIRKLAEKKHRDQRKLFLVEGEKSLLELLGSDFEIEFLVMGATFHKHHYSLVANKIEKGNIRHRIIDEAEIKSLSTLEHNIAGIAIVKQKENIAPKIHNEIMLALDAVRDPGNLGTIMRIADWYGIRNVIASEDTADYYNPKSISASMGSFARVNIHYTNLFSYLEAAPFPILGSFLDGSNAHTMSFPDFGILVIGNESNGISSNIKQLIKHKITIPRFGKAESLNAAIATAVILDNWIR